MPASRTGLFESLRQLLHTALALAQLRLELLAADLEIEKLRLIEFALRALLGIMLLGLSLLLLIGFVLLLLWDGYRLPALGVLTLLCLGGGIGLLQAAKRRLRHGEGMFAATRAEFERDQAALRPPE
ncbi:MAG TPA: phage holin family protein [Rubrivivax sp.]|nr:phage holin family protein [Rubrivivax sp.]